MKTLPPGLQAHLDTGATTLCWCWRLTKRDGTRLGFTDHDLNLVFDGTAFEAATGFTASEIRDSVGLAVDNLEVESAITSDRLSEEALASGDFDDAPIEIFRVNWSDPSQRVLMRSGSLGEVRRSGPSFVAEVRGLAHYLQQPRGRLYQLTCDADLGDSRCTIDLASATWRGTGSVLTVSADRLLTVSGLAAFADGWFTRGRLSFTSGVNAGRAMEIKRHALSAGIATLELWQAMAVPVVPGDAFAVTAGCDKRFETCRDRFANGVNFRGFPHMPGNDFVMSYPRADHLDNDGAPR